MKTVSLLEPTDAAVQQLLDRLRQWWIHGVYDCYEAAVFARVDVPRGHKTKIHRMADGKFVLKHRLSRTPAEWLEYILAWVDSHQTYALFRAPVEKKLGTQPKEGCAS